MISWFAAGLKHPASARSSRSGEATGAVRGAAPFRSAVFARFVQAAPHTVGVEVLGVDRRTGLLPPGLVQTAGIDAIKAQFFDELQNDGLGCVVIARNWQGDAPGRAYRPAQFEKVSGVNVVERFDHRPANLLLDPPALRQARLDRLDASVALAWVIVAGIDDNHPVRRIGEQTGREVRNILLRNGNHDEIHAANGFWDRHSGRAGFGGQVGERFGTSRVCYKNLVSQRGKATAQRAANLGWPAPMMPIFMFASYGWIAEAMGRSRKPKSASSGADYPAR